VSWFEDLMGFRESSPTDVRTRIRVLDGRMRSEANGKTFACGELEIPSLRELRARARRATPGQMRVRELVSGVQELHRDRRDAHCALFQVASQFNLLEMASPGWTPEHGVGIYEDDHTQGPACAIAAGAGTIYRNYFVEVRGQVGQSYANQIDCLDDLGQALGNGERNRLWEMRNGYALATRNGLERLRERLWGASESELDQLRQLLRVGWQRNTEVTLPGAGGHLVDQLYCSALPVAYCGSLPKRLWEPFARLVLEAAYEATLCAAIAGGHRRTYLTLLGGGAFGNEPSWILAAIERALNLYGSAAEMDVVIVSHTRSNPAVQRMIERSAALPAQGR